MRKSLFFAAVAIGLFASCTINEIHEIQDSSQVISFQTVAANPTKADTDNHPATDHKGFIEGEIYPTNASFVSAAYGLDGAPFITPSEVRWHPAETINGVELAAGWRTDQIYYWPSFNLTFFSASPYYLYEQMNQNEEKFIITNAGITITDFDIEAYPDTDLMIADMQAQVNLNSNSISSNGVATIFRHKLTQIVDFKFRLDRDHILNDDGTFSTGDYKIFVNKIELIDIPTVSTYTVITPNESLIGEWRSNNESYKSFVLYENSNVTDFDGVNVIDAFTDETAQSLYEKQGKEPFIIIPSSTLGSPKQSIKITANIYRYQDAIGSTPAGWVLVKTKDTPVSISQITPATDHSLKLGSKYIFTVVIDPIVDPKDPTHEGDKTPIYWDPSVTDWTTTDTKFYI